MEKWKRRTIAEIEKGQADDALKLIAELKVALLPDFDANGGLREHTRRRAWRMVNELGKLLLAKDKQP
jgi:hypothetical protein